MEYAQNQAINWREDSSNEKTDYTRNKIRHELKPILNSIDMRYEKAALRLAKEVQKIRMEGGQILKNNFGDCLAQGEFFVSSDFWENQLFLVKELLLETWCGSNSQLQEIERFYREAKTGVRLEFPERFYVLREKDGLWFGQHKLDEFKKLNIDWSKAQQTNHYKVQKMDYEEGKVVFTIHSKDQLEIRKIGSGETLNLQDGQRRKVKKIFNDEKWKHYERKKALGWYLNDKLIGIIRPLKKATLELGEKSSGKLMKIIKILK